MSGTTKKVQPTENNYKTSPGGKKKENREENNIKKGKRGTREG
jgi:hypothetical protein